ncbi:hypothetical protein HN747_05015, partial [archaeon]|nr:hypothetical protein [archaeon]
MSKIIQQGYSALSKFAIRGTGIGVSAILGSTLLNKPTASSGPDSPISASSFTGAGFFERQATMFSLGLAGGMGSIGTLPKYQWARTKDTAASFATKPVGYGAAGGAAIGAAGGAIIGAFTRQPLGRALKWSAGLGAAGGAYTARKVQMNIVKGISESRRAVYKKSPMGNKGRGGGSGFRTWTNQRTMGKPGHL